MRALLSVANREGIVPFARDLLALGVEVFATDGTREALAAEGIEVRSVSELTGSEPIAGGQVKTLHPAIYAGILARRDQPDQLAELEAQKIGLIDIVAVNVSRFAPQVGRPPRADRRGHRDDRRRRRGAAGRGRPQLRRRRGRGQPGPLRRRSSPRSGSAAPSPPSCASGSRPRRTGSSPPTTPRSPRTCPTSPATSSPDGWRWCWRRSTTCATARTRPSAPPSTARRRTAPARWPTPPSSRGRGRRSTTCWTWTPPTPSPPTSPPRP